MPKIIRNALNTKKIAAFKKPGFYADGEGLYILVKPTGGKWWIYRYRLGDKRRDMGLGAFPDVGLADARRAAGDVRQLLEDGQDPVTKRKVESARVVTEREAMPTFGEFGLQMVSLWGPTFRNAKHLGQWESSVKVSCKKLFDLPINQIDTDLVLSVLRPMWKTTPVTARRVQGRIKRILDAAKVAGHRPRNEENPAAWDGHGRLGRASIASGRAVGCVGQSLCRRDRPDPHGRHPGGCSRSWARNDSNRQALGLCLRWQRL